MGPVGGGAFLCWEGGRFSCVAKQDASSEIGEIMRHQPTNFIFDSVTMYS